MRTLPHSLLSEILGGLQKVAFWGVLALGNKQRTAGQESMYINYVLLLRLLMRGPTAAANAWHAWVLYTAAGTCHTL